MSSRLTDAHGEELSLRIEIVDVESLHLHEEIVLELLNSLTYEIIRDGVLRHPIIVDRNTYVVLDGAHRVAALRQAGYSYAPAFLVDYEDSAIAVFRWYRIVKGEEAFERALEAVKQSGFLIKEGVDCERIGIPPIVAALKSATSASSVYSSFQDLKEAYDYIKRIEEKLKELSLEIGYESEFDALNKLKKGEVDVVLLTPKLSKRDVIEAALSKRVLPYKVTRHVVPNRPLYLNVPLELLKGCSIEKANEELKKALKKGRWKVIAAGSLIEGRRYEENLYIFEGL